MKGFRLDKRVVIFSLFSLPIIMVLLISYVVNSQPLYEGSKAKEAPEGTGITPTVTSAPLKEKITCLNPQVIASKQSVDLLPEQAMPLDMRQPAKIYSVGPASLQYISLVEMPLPTGTGALTSIKTSLVEHGALMRFVAVQGQSEDAAQSGSAFEERLRLTARECQAVVLE